jgi:hypothetical protein
MTKAVRIINAMHWLALTAWVAALVTAGIAAMNTFTRLPRMNLELRDYQTLPTDEHGRLAAGMVMEGVFKTVDWMQIIAAPMAVLTLIVILALTQPSWRSVPNVLRCVCIIVAAGLFAYHITALAPTMNRHLHGYWDELKAGRLPEAQAQLKSFDRLHPIASGLLKIDLALLIVGIASTALMGVPSDDKRNRCSFATSNSP